MTNGRGMTTLENFGKVTSGMIDLYDPQSEEYVRLERETPQWEQLAKKLYVIYCFLKRQQKRDPEECDRKFYKLWNVLKGSFTGMKFDKFHGLFCTSHNFIYKYHMAGRVSEESNEAFNAVLANVKRMLRCMSATVGRIKTINQQTQVKLKSSVA